MISTRRIRWVIALLLLWGLGHTAAFAYGYDQNAQFRDWGYQPLSKSPSASSVASVPTYQFHTTSIYITSSEESYSPSSIHNGPRRAYAWNDWSDEDDEIGTVTKTTPLGDTPWLFMVLLAAGYSALRILRIHRKKRHS